MLRAARESARTVACLSQLRQIGYAIQQYTVANRGMTPYYSGRHEYPNDVQRQGDPNWFGPGWPALIEQYLGQKPDGKVWNCPNWPDGERRVNYFLAARWLRFQEPLLRSIPISRIRNSTTYIFVGECVAQSYYPPPFGTSLVSDFDDIDKDDGATKCLTFAGELDGGFNMHMQGNNVLFADNHAATFRKYDAQSLSYSPDDQKTWKDLEK